MTKELKKPSIVFIMGSQGVGKTTFTEELKFPRFDRDILDVIGPTSSRYNNIFFPRHTLEINKTTLYDAIIKLAIHNIPHGAPVILEGNFGTRLNKEFLFSTFGDKCFEKFNFYIIRISCKDPAMQYNRIMARGPEEIARCRNIKHNNKKYDLTKYDSFIKYINIRDAEERECIENLCNWVNIINIDNSIKYEPEVIAAVADKVREIISTNNKVQVIDLIVSNFRIRKSGSQVNFVELSKAVNEALQDNDRKESSDDTTATSPVSSPTTPSASPEILNVWRPSTGKMPYLVLPCSSASTTMTKPNVG